MSFLSNRPGIKSVFVSTHFKILFSVRNYFDFYYCTLFGFVFYGLYSGISIGYLTDCTTVGILQHNFTAFRYSDFNKTFNFFCLGFCLGLSNSRCFCFSLNSGFSSFLSGFCTLSSFCSLCLVLCFFRLSRFYRTGCLCLNFGFCFFLLCLYSIVFTRRISLCSHPFSSYLRFTNRLSSDLSIRLCFHICCKSRCWNTCRNCSKCQDNRQATS